MMLSVALRTEWRLKTARTVGLALAFCLPYFTLQHARFPHARELPLTWIDRAIGFEPAWIWVYQSAYLLLPLGPWLAAARRELRAYTAGFLLHSGAGFALFAFFPVACPRPDSAEGDWMYRLVASYDGKGNAFPSLHCALAVFSALYLDGSSLSRLSRRAQSALRFALVLWTGAIGFSTLATKQHYFVDVPAGAVLGWSCHWIAWRTFRQRRRLRGWVGARRARAGPSASRRRSSPWRGSWP